MYIHVRIMLYIKNEVILVGIPPITSALSFSLSDDADSIASLFLLLRRELIEDLFEGRLRDGVVQNKETLLVPLDQTEHLRESSPGGSIFFICRYLHSYLADLPLTHLNASEVAREEVEQRVHAGLQEVPRDQRRQEDSVAALGRDEAGVSPAARDVLGLADRGEDLLHLRTRDVRVRASGAAGAWSCMCIEAKDDEEEGEEDRVSSGTLWPWRRCLLAR